MTVLRICRVERFQLHVCRRAEVEERDEQRDGNDDEATSERQATGIECVRVTRMRTVNRLSTQRGPSPVPVSTAGCAEVA